MERVYLFSDGSARVSWGWTVMERVYLFSDGLGQSELGWDGDGEGLPFL